MQECSILGDRASSCCAVAHGDCRGQCTRVHKNGGMHFKIFTINMTAWEMRLVMKRKHTISSKLTYCQPYTISVHHCLQQYWSNKCPIILQGIFGEILTEVKKNAVPENCCFPLNQTPSLGWVPHTAPVLQEDAEPSWCLSLMTASVHLLFWGWGAATYILPLRVIVLLKEKSDIFVAK